MLDKHEQLKRARAEREVLLLAYNALADGGINRHPSGTLTTIVEKIADNVEAIARLEKEIDPNA